MFSLEALIFEGETQAHALSGINTRSNFSV